MIKQLSFYVTDWIDKRAKFTGDRIALHDLGNQKDITYHKWNENANRTANFLRELGIKKGDRVAVYASNRVAYLDVWMACGKLGAILQNLNWRLAVPEIQALINDAEPMILIYSSDFAEAVNTMRANLPSIRHFICFDEGDDRFFREREQFSPDFSMDSSLHPDDPWVICYTGGTTGLPKGVLLTHGNLAWNAVNTVSSWGLDQHDVAILNAPLFHTGGLNVFTLPLVSVGGKSIVCTNFSADDVFNLVESGGVTVFFGVPTMFLMLQQHERWEQADFSKLKLVISGGAPCPMPIFEKFWAKGVDFKTGYGLTEAGPNTFFLPPADVRRKPGAVGFPLMHIDVKTIRSDGTICQPNEAGELIIRGPHVTIGYWKQPETTAATIRDGWLHTGDLAICDDEGYYTIVGRLKDMIISGGENIYPAEVESVMHAYEGVQEAALIGIPDEKWGEVGKAVVVPTPSFDETAFFDFLKTRLAKYKIPKSVVCVEALPRTGPGKIDKKLLVEAYGGKKS